MVDAMDLKSIEGKTSCRFESGLGYLKKIASVSDFLLPKRLK